MRRFHKNDMTKWPISEEGQWHAIRFISLPKMIGGTLQFSATYVDKCHHWSLLPFLKLVFCLATMRDTRFNNFYSYSVSLFSFLSDYTDV